MRRYLAVAAVGTALTLAAFATTATGASAGPTPKVTGGIELSSTQYASFSAFDDVAGDKGEVTYTNFGYLAPGSDVWKIAGEHQIVFTYGGQYAHTMNVTSIDPLSNNSIAFSGTGFYNANSAYTWTVEGTVIGAAVEFHMLYTGIEAGYMLHANGTIAADGSVAGSSSDSWGRTLPWTMPTGSAEEVLSYTADVTCAIVSDWNATFGFTIPAGFPGLSGVNVVAKVYDGGSPGAYDTWGHGIATGPCTASMTYYPITSGNLVVHN